MNKIRSVFFGSVSLFFSHSAFAAPTAVPSDLKTMASLICQNGKQCEGSNCVTLQAESESGQFGFTGSYRDGQGQLLALTCGAWGTSYSASVPAGIQVQFGARFFITGDVPCNDGEFFLIDSDTKVMYKYGANPNSCTVTTVD